MNKLSAHIFAIALIGAGLALGTASIAHMANANGILVQEAQPSLWSKERNGTGDAPRIQVFVNLPLHNALANTYNKANVPFSYTVKWAVCDNEETGVRIITRYDANGGLHTNVNGDANTQWKEVSQQTHSEQKCGSKYCLTSRSYSSNGINMSDVKGNHTTLQVIAKSKSNIRRPYVLPDSSIPTNPDIYNSYDGHTIVNIHLHWAQVATATPTPTPTVMPTPTPTLTPAPVTRVTCLENGKEIVITSTNANINCNSINNVVTVKVDNSSNNSSNNSSKNNNEVKVEQKVEVKTVAKKPAPKKAKVAAAVQVAPQYIYVTPQVVHVPVTAKTGPTALATLFFTTLTGGSGLAYVIRKAIVG